MLWCELKSGGLPSATFAGRGGTCTRTNVKQQTFAFSSGLAKYARLVAQSCILPLLPLLQRHLNLFLIKRLFLHSARIYCLHILPGPRIAMVIPGYPASRRLSQMLPQIPDFVVCKQPSPLDYYVNPNPHNNTPS